MRSRFVSSFLLFCLLPLAALAQAVRWEPSDNDASELILTFENCTPDPLPPPLPPVNGQLRPTGTGTRVEINNFKRVDYIQITYQFRVTNGTQLKIPAFDVKTDKGSIHVPEFTAAPAQRNSSLDSAAVSHLETGRTTVWAGEVFPITYTLDVARRNLSQLESAPTWTPAPLVAEDWIKPVPSDRVVNGEARIFVTYGARAYVKTPGPVTLNSIEQAVRLQTGSMSFGLFQAPRLEQVTVTSDRPSLTVRALPPAPPGFSGGVGQFKLVSKVIPEKAAVGEPVTWTLELSGPGNWPDLGGLPQREVSTDFQVIQPKAKRTPADGKLFDVTLTEDVVLVPTKPGKYTLGPLNFVYFDPDKASYQTITAPRTTLTIGAPEASKFAVTPNAPSAAVNPVEAGSNGEPPAAPKPPTPPAAIPRDPLPGSAEAFGPMSVNEMVTCVVLPFVVVLVTWFVLALRRAQQTDPSRPRREARVRLAALLREMSGTTDPAVLREQILRWQHDSAVLWQVAHAAPAAHALPDAAWAQLWAESDRALYGANPALPSDWIARAEAALVAKRVPGFNALDLFRPRNIFPFAALVLVSLVLSSHARAAEKPPLEAYSSGDFAGAEKSWRAVIAKSPTDWIARHNLSLALAQQDKNTEAAVQAAVAFVQNPTDPALRWHLAFAAEKANLTTDIQGTVLEPSLVRAFANHASPPTWERVMIGGALVAALGLISLLFNSYGPRSGAARWTAVAVLGIGLLLGVAGLVGTASFGFMADGRSVVIARADTLRSIPTEADNSQKTSPLSPGTIAIADRTFLRWTHLIFQNGQTGWVRREAYIAVWK